MGSQMQSLRSRWAYVPFFFRTLRLATPRPCTCETTSTNQLAIGLVAFTLYRCGTVPE